MKYFDRMHLIAAPARIRRICLLASTLLMAATVAVAQAKSAQQTPVVPQTSGAPANVVDCGVFAAQNANLDLISKLCVFALTYRSKLPDFIAQQTTTSHGLRSTVVITAQVTYRGGLEQYSQLAINGKLVPPNTKVPVDLHLFTTGEFGPLLINLFEVPGTTEFKFRRTDTLEGSPVAIYDFRLPKAKNTFWSLRDPKGEILKPEYRGQIWLEQQTGRLVREQLEPAVNENETWIASAKLYTDYAITNVKDAGSFLLPVRSESKMCLGGPQFNLGCTTNIVSFHDYQKFVATSRIVPAESQP